MRILELSYQNKSLKWRLEKVAFSKLTLLVGISGVGKTQILKAINSLRSIATGTTLNGIEWNVKFETNDKSIFEWSGAFEQKERILNQYPGLSNSADIDKKDKPAILYEHLTKDEKVLVDRSSKKLFLNGEETPKLSPHKSSLDLFSYEDDISPASNAFLRILYSNPNVFQSDAIRLYDVGPFDSIIKKYNTFEKLQDSDIDTIIKLAVVNKSYIDVFNKIKERFIEIFPFVADIKIEPLDDEDMPIFFRETPRLQIREKGLNNWIRQEQISSGMIRTLMHIAEMFLWPEGTVILIDEFENSLGVNCIDILTEDLTTSNRRLQFIITSHHPYIINNISSNFWKVVRRKGGRVYIEDASALNLGTSSHESFIKLMNSDYYTEGIATE